MDKKKARVIAFYLPQFHPIPENDKWWGKGFTEWTNVAKAKPTFKGHLQPKIPTDLGFYDLRLPEVREEQAKLARRAGVEGFMYWHYWFGKGKQLLERPFNEVLNSGKPDFPFCLGWANHDWSNKTWNKTKAIKTTTILMKQTYVESEYVDHFYDILPAFKDKRYICVDGKPLFLIFSPSSIPNCKSFIDCWQQLASQNGLSGIYFVGYTTNIMMHKDNGKGNAFIPDPYSSPMPIYQNVLDLGFDAVAPSGILRAEFKVQSALKYAIRKAIAKYMRVEYGQRFDYGEIIKNLYTDEDKNSFVFPTVISTWDCTPRRGKTAEVFYGVTPELFKKQVESAIKLLEERDDEHKVIFLKSWNEWGEGNYMEPDMEFGHGLINALASALKLKDSE